MKEEKINRLFKLGFRNVYECLDCGAVGNGVEAVQLGYDVNMEMVQNCKLCDSHKLIYHRKP